MDFFHITVSARTPPLWLHSVFLMLVGIYWRWSPELKSLLIMEETELSKIYFLVLFFSGG